MSDPAAVLGAILVTLAAEWGYAAAFGGAFERQLGVVRSRPLLSLGVGFAAAAAWTLLGKALLSGGHGGALLTRALTVPIFLAAAAGGAVSLGAAAGRVLGADPAEKPYACIAAGQLAAALLGLVPRLGVLVVTFYACSGAGAILVAEFSGTRREREGARLGWTGAACFVGLTAAISLLLTRALRP